MTTVSQSKERILAAAKELFLAGGYAATTVDAICEKAELTKGSFYYSFDSKEDLGIAVLDWSLRRSVEMLASGPHSWSLRLKRFRRGGADGRARRR